MGVAGVQSVIDDAVILMEGRGGARQLVFVIVVNAPGQGLHPGQEGREEVVGRHLSEAVIIKIVFLARTKAIGPLGSEGRTGLAKLEHGLHALFSFSY